MRIVITGAAREQFDFLLSAVLQDIRRSFRSDLSYLLCPKLPIFLINIPKSYSVYNLSLW